MQVVVRPHVLIRARLHAWRQSLSGDPLVRNELFLAYWSELVRRIVEAQGPPAESVVVRTTVPPTYWCELTGGTWVELSVRPDRRHGIFGPVVREVVVTGLEPHPPGGTPPGTR